jgi:chitin synthase
MAANHAAQAIASGDLTDLVSASTQATIYPNDDAILAVLQARFRADLPYSRIGSSSLVAVNPYKSLANVNDASARDYEERCYRDTSLPMVDSPRPLQPHLYDLAARLYLLMRRRRESQTVISRSAIFLRLFSVAHSFYRGITGSGKSSSLRLLLSQILRLSSRSKKETRIAEQIQALGTVLDSFGNAKTLMNPNASRHGRYLELHFTDKGKINSAKVLTYGLDKSRLSKLSHEERTYHVFYQLLAGITPQERDALMVEDASDYALLASSGCYRLPSGPFSDDTIAMDDLRAAMRTLGFKQKHMTSIFSLLVAILLLGNLQFADPDAKDVAAYIANPHVIDHAARLLGVSSDDLSQVLTTKTSYVRKELYTVLLNAEQAAGQRDHCVRDLYAILFAFVVETANHRLAPSPKDPPPPTQIVLLDQPGFQTRGPSGTTSVALTGNAPLIAAYGQNGFEEFCVNFNDELLHSYITRNSFENVGFNGQIASDGITLPNISTMDNGACVELLRGAQLSERSQRKPAGLLGVINKACSSYKSGKGNEHRDENLLQEMGSKFGVHASYAASPGVGGTQDRFLFGINHYAGSASYDIRGFVEKDSDLLDSAYVTLLRGSHDAFVSKLLSGPSLAAERHNKDENIIVQAQVSSRPLRQPTPILSPDGTFPTDDHGRLDPSKTYPVTAQLNFTTSEILSSIDKTHLWTISCIRPNDSSSPNSFDKRRVKNQIRALLLPDLVARKSVDYVVDYELGAFCERYVPRMRGSCEERITQCVRSNGWKEGLDYVVGHRCIWLSYSAWKVVEDQVRAAEKEQGKVSGEIEDDDPVDDFGTEYTHQEGGIGLGGGTQSVYYGGGVSESADNLLNINNTGGYGGGGLATPNLSKGFGGSPGETGDGAWSDWDHKSPSLLGGGGGNGPPYNSPGMLAKEMVVKEAPNAVEEVPTTRSRRVWLWIVTIVTFWIPNFLLKCMGRMKRPDVQLAWREKITIFWLIFILNGVVVFYIVEFGRLLCPTFDKAWNIDELGGHQGKNDYFVAIQGVVYDVTNFVFGDHSDVNNLPSDTPDVLDSLAGQDLTAYFPVPLTLGCPGLVTDPNMVLTVKNTSTIVQPLAVHKSGSASNGQSKGLSANDWYTSTFLPRIKEFKKGPLVWDWKRIQGYAQDQDIQKCVSLFFFFFFYVFLLLNSDFFIWL